MPTRRIRLVPRTPYIGTPVGEDLACQSGAPSLFTSGGTSNNPYTTTVVTLDDITQTEMSTAGFSGTSDADLTFPTAATDSAVSGFTRTVAGSVARIRFPATLTVGSSTVNAQLAHTGSLGVYLDFDLLVSSNWYGHSTSGVGKLFYVTGGTVAAAPFYVSVQGTTTNSLALQVRTQDCPPGKGGAAPGSTSFNVPETVSLTRGVKRRIEIQAVMNSVDGSNNAVEDGTLKIWADGTLVCNRSTMAYRGADTGVNGVKQTGLFNALKMTTIYGGSGGVNPPADQYLYVGYLKLARS